MVTITQRVAYRYISLRGKKEKKKKHARLSVTDPVYFQENVVVIPNPILVQLPIFIETAAIGHRIATLDGFVVMAI